MPDEEQSKQTRPVIVEERDSVVVIRLNRPAERNSLSIVTLAELDAIVSALTAQTSISTIIFTGTGDTFASGANIRELTALTPETAREFARRGQRLMQRIADAPQLSIAAINGSCMGGGLDLALAYDLRYASSSSTTRYPRYTASSCWRTALRRTMATSCTAAARRRTPSPPPSKVNCRVAFSLPLSRFM